MSEVPGPPEEEQQFKAPAAGDENDSLEQMQQEINETADSMGIPRAGKHVDYEGQEVVGPRKMPEQSEENTSEVNAQIADLKEKVVIKERLESLRDKGRYGVVAEGVQKNHGERPDTFASTSEEREYLRKMTRELSSRKYIPDTLRGLQRDKERRAKQEGGRYVEYVDRGNKEEHRKSDNMQELIERKVQYFREQIIAEKARAHDLYRRDPERYNNMPVSEFLDKKDEYEKDTDVFEYSVGAEFGLMQAEYELSRLDIEDAGSISPIKHSIEAASIALFYNGIGNISSEAKNYPSNSDKVTELAILLGDALFGDTVFDESAEHTAYPFFSEFKGNTDTDDSGAIKYGMIAKGMFGGEIVGSYDAIEPAEMLFAFNPDKSPKQLFNELTERIKIASAKAKEMATKARHEIDEKWGEKPKPKEPEQAQAA